MCTSELRRNPKRDIPVKLVESSKGMTIKLQVTKEHAEVAKMYMSQLENYAKALKTVGHTTVYNISGNQITLQLTEEIAEQHFLTPNST